MEESCEDGNSARMNLWCELPQNVLELILSRIPLEERGRFASVCRWWRMVEKQSPLPQLPWLLLKRNSQLEAKETMSFFSLLDGQIHHIELPFPDVATGQPIDCCQGWIVMAYHFSGWQFYCLLNPITREKICCPSVLAHTGHSPYRFYLVSDPTAPNDVLVFLTTPTDSKSGTVEIFQPSLGTCEWRGYTLSSWKWEAFNQPITVTSCHSKLYFLDRKLNLSVLRVNGERRLVEMSNSDMLGYPAFLVECCGDVLAAVGYSYGNEAGGKKHGSYRFAVFRADLDAKMWVQVESLGDQMLFLSRGSSFSVAATANSSSGSSSSSCLQGNKIYYLPADRWFNEFNQWIEFDLGSGICVARKLPNNRYGRCNTWRWLRPTSWS